MATTPIYGWRLPDLGVVANAPDAFLNLGTDIENTLANASVNSYTPAWTSGGSAQPANPTSKVGRYKVTNGWCDIAIFLTYGASVNGGEGILSLSLPVAASSAIPEQILRAKTWLPNGGNFEGVAIVNASATVIGVQFNQSAALATMDWWRGSNGAGSPLGSGVPSVAGQYGVQANGNMAITGRYLTV